MTNITTILRRVYVPINKEDLTNIAIEENKVDTKHIVINMSGRIRPQALIIEGEVTKVTAIEVNMEGGTKTDLGNYLSTGFKEPIDKLIIRTPKKTVYVDLESNK